MITCFIKLIENTYNYTDQVGNIRLAYYRDASGNPKIDRVTDYYPF
ncbi:hypothetical protein ACNFU2_06965 [Chryseobacterium sp. PTM-20240506]